MPIDTQLLQLLAHAQGISRVARLVFNLLMFVGINTWELLRDLWLILQ